MHQVLFFLLRRLMRRAVHLDNQFPIEQGEIRKILEAPERILMPVPLTKRRYRGLQRSFGRRRVIAPVLPVS